MRLVHGPDQATGTGWGGRYSALAYTDRLRLTVTTQTVNNYRANTWSSDTPK